LTLRKRKKGGRHWEFRFYEPDSQGKDRRRAITVGAEEDYPSESAVRKSPEVQALLLRVNAEDVTMAAAAPKFGAVIARYEQEEMPDRHSTKTSYRSYIQNHIGPRWGDTPIDKVRPMPVEDWLKGLKLAPKTKAHLRSLMHTVFKCAERWELIARNPIKLVRVKGGTKRQMKPRILTVEEFHRLLQHLREPYRTMVLVAGCLGLRVSEIMGLRWEDINFANMTMLVQRSVVHGRVGDVKTEYSKDRLPLDPALVEVLLLHRDRCVEYCDGWLFANPDTGRPYHQEQIQKTHLKSAAVAAGISGRVGWHTFRHSYRAWLDAVGSSVSVQQGLMRHASVQTTMNVYGGAMPEDKREAHCKVVQMILPPGMLPALGVNAQKAS
jgi:integrase